MSPRVSTNILTASGQHAGWASTTTNENMGSNRWALLTLPPVAFHQYGAISPCSWVFIDSGNVLPLGDLLHRPLDGGDHALKFAIGMDGAHEPPPFRNQVNELGQHGAAESLGLLLVRL